MIVLLLLCAPAPVARAASTLSWSVAASPFRLSVLDTDGTVVTEAPGLRLQYALNDGSVHGVTGLVRYQAVTDGARYALRTDEPGRSATLVVRRTARGLSVQWTLVPATDVVRSSEAFAGKPTEHFLGSGERTDRVDLQSSIVGIKAWNSCNSRAPAPFFLSSAGYGIRVASTAVGTLAFPRAEVGSAFGSEFGSAFSCEWGTSPCPVASDVPATQICMKQAGMAYEVYAGNPSQIVSAYAEATGRPAMPQQAQLELIQWRDQVTGAQQVIDDARTVQQLGMPLGWTILDNPWEAGGCNGSLTFDPTRVPDPSSLIAALHDSGVRLMLWISPNVTTGSPCATGWPDGALFDGGQGAAVVDLTLPSARSEFVRRLTALLALGVDGFKVDRGDEIDSELRHLAGGPGELLQNQYPVLLAAAVKAAFTAAGRPEVAIFRSAGPGSAPLVSGFWTGDQTGDLHGLRSAIRAIQTAGLAGLSTIGSDIGGYVSAELTPEVFVRWAQLGAVSPVFEVGGQGLNATFWQFDSQTLAIFRRYAVLHYELFPFLYQLAATAHATGIPIIRSLGLQYPADSQAWAHPLEFTIGSDLLAAPVDQPASGGTTPFAVYLPRGSWLDLFSGKSYRGPLSFARPTPLSELPLFLSEGAAIPFNLREPDVWPTPWQIDALSQPDRSGWLYAPGTGTTVRSNGRFRAEVQGTTISLAADSTPTVQLMVLLAKPPRALRIGGRAASASASAEELRSRDTGWLWVPSPFRGVLVKVRSGEQVEIER